MENQSLNTIVAKNPLGVDGSARGDWNAIRSYLAGAGLEADIELALLCETAWRLRRLDSATSAWQGTEHAIEQVFETGRALQPARSPLSLFICGVRHYVPMFCDLRAPERPDAFQWLGLGPLELSPLITAATHIRARPDSPVFLPVLAVAELRSNVSSGSCDIFNTVDEILVEPGMLRDLDRRRARWVANQLMRGWMNASEVARYLRENLIDSPRTRDPLRITDHDATHTSAAAAGRLTATGVPAP